MDPIQVILLVILGVFVGTLGTLIGAGGGFILTPILLLTHKEWSQETITGVSLGVIFCNGLSGTIGYMRRRRVDLRSALWFSAAAIPGSLVGLAVQPYIPRNVFAMMLAAFLVFVSLLLLIKGEPVRARGTGSAPIGEDFWGPGVPHHRPTGIAIAFVAGVVASLLGIGGGIIHVPAMVHLMEFPVHTAIPTSHFVLAASAASATAGHLWDGSLQPGLWHVVTIRIGAIIGEQVGAAISDRVSGPVILRLLGVALLVVASRVIWVTLTAPVTAH